MLVRWSDRGVFEAIKQFIFVEKRQEVVETRNACIKLDFLDFRLDGSKATH